MKLINKKLYNIRLYVTFGIVLTTILCVNAIPCRAQSSATVKTPDFAYPETVITDAKANLQKALKDHDGVLEIKSLLELLCGNAAIDPQRLPSFYHLTDSLAKTAPDKPTEALLNLVCAKVLWNCFDIERYKYSQRDTPDTPLPEDVRLWNMNQLFTKIGAHILDALAIAPELNKIATTDYADILDLSGNAIDLCPTMNFTIYTIAMKISSKFALNLSMHIDDLAIKEAEKGSLLWCYFTWLKATSDPKKDISKMMRLYRENQQYEGSAIFLQEVTQEMDVQWTPIDTVKAAVDDIDRYLKQFPTGLFNDNLYNSKINLTKAYVQLGIGDEFVITGKPLKIRATVFNTPSLTVKITGKNNFREEFTFTQAVPFKVDTIIEFTPLKNGEYTVSVDFPSASEKNSTIKFNAIDIYPFIFKGAKGSKLVVADYNTGQPVKGVKATIYYYNYLRNKKNIIKTVKIPGYTDTKGILPLNCSKKYDWDYISLSYNGDRYDYDERLTLPRSYDDSREDNVEFSIFTDRSIYHKGDSVNIAVVSYKEYGKTLNVLPFKEKKLKIFIKDPNYKNIDTLDVVTDKMGLATASFKLPEETRSGRFSILVKYPKKGNRNYFATQYITVSDFVLPTYQVTADKIQRDYPSKGCVTIVGNVSTFSGMPIADASIEGVVSSARVSWRSTYPGNELGTVKTVTDDQGNYELVISDSLFTNSNDYENEVEFDEEDEYDYFDEENHNNHEIQFGYCKITASIPSGEVEETSTCFSIGKPYIISYSGLQNLDVSKPFRLNYTVIDASNNTIDIPVKWQIRDKHKTVVSSGEIADSSQPIDFSSIKGGNYILELSSVDSTLAESVKVAVNLYNTITGSMPENNLLYIPKMVYSADKDNKAEVLIGIPHDDTYIYYDTPSDNDVKDITVKKMSSGFIKIPVTVPDGFNQASLNIISVKNGKITEKEILIKISRDHKLAIKAESMRDKVTPGSKETWTFKVKPSENYIGTPSSYSMIATMYNQALEKLNKNYQWGKTILFPYKNYISGIENFYHRNLGLYIYGNTLKERPVFTLKWPEFEPEIHNFMHRHSIVIRGVNSGGVPMKQKLSSESVSVEDMSADSGTMLNEVAFAESSKDNSVTGAVFGMTATIIENSSADSSKPVIDYRPAETLQAFWKPNVKVDNDGTASISFEVPNSLGAWAFNAFAWDNIMGSGNYNAVVTAAKPVMINPLWPQFLRRGDKAIVSAMVYNATDSAYTAEVEFEYFDVVSNKTLGSQKTTVTLPANGSTTADMTLSADFTGSMIGMRARVDIPGFADGEQIILPILDAFTEVTEGEFYAMSPGDKELSTTLPEGNNALIAFDFNDNPAWDVVKTLPALRKNESSTSTSAAESLFEAVVASGIINTWPGVADMLKTWRDNPADSALVSKLSQNDMLKQTALNFTPWVREADSDTERMTSLSLLLDRKTVTRNISKSLDKLKSMQNSDGGFSWGSWNKQSSLWATSRVLNSLARLKLTGYYPADKKLDELVLKAVNYYEKTLSKNKLDRFQSGYAYGVSVLPGKPQTLGGQEIFNFTLKQMMKEWKSYSPTGKARCAITLYLSGYKSQASEIMKSLEQFVVPTDNGKGSFIPRAVIDEVAEILLAFGTIDPKSPVVNQLRQWLTMRTAVTVQQGAYDPTLLAAAYIKTGDNWLVPATAPKLSVADKEIKLPETATRLGSFSLIIPSKDAGGKLLLTRAEAGTPAYGSLLTRMSRKIEDVTAKGCDEITITKTIVAMEDGKAKYVNTVKPGSKVKTILTIEVKTDLQYVTVIDQRAACLRPIEQLPGYVYSGGVSFYKENTDSETHLFIEYLPRGIYTIEIESSVIMAGEFISGLASVQSQLAPAVTAHSAGSTIISTAK